MLSRRRPLPLVGGLALGLALAASPAFAGDRLRFEATAYSDPGGETAAGTTARRGIVASDPRILPIGSRIRIEGAGQYSGEYTVEDTGRGIKGHELDIHMADPNAAKRFGRKTVDVEVLQHGAGARGR